MFILYILLFIFLYMLVTTLAIKVYPKLIPPKNEEDALFCKIAAFLWPMTSVGLLVLFTVIGFYNFGMKFWDRISGGKL